MKADDRALAKLAASIADGTPVDWRAADAQDPRVRRLAGHLRLVDSIAALHRSIPPEELVDTLPEPAPVPGGKSWGRLVLLERVGEGMSGEVYRAWDSELHREVALKLLHGEGEADAHKRVLGEARRLARIRHQHVVNVYGAEQHDGSVGLWMELVRGTSLERLVQERGPLGPNEAVLIGLDVCAAVAAVHGAGLLHRDIKAQNVMREAGGRIVLMDFGTGEELAGTKRIVGTPLYLAPEILRGQRASVQSDVYSVGVLLFYLVTGAFPVTAGSMEELSRAHQNRVRRPLRDLRPDAPEGFVRVVEQTLDGDPARRYKSIGELEAALREALTPAGRVPVDAPGSLLPTPSKAGHATLSRWPSRGVMTLVAAAAIAIVLAAGALVVRNRTAPDAGPPAAARVAVLPLRDLSPAASPPYLADQLTDQLISTLGQIRSIHVTSLTSVLPFKSAPTPLAEVARRLHVDHLVEATLAVTQGPDGTPDRVRVSARLLVAGTEAQIWSRDFERSLGDTLALQADVAQAIATGIRAALSPDERRRLENRRSTSPAANDAYYQGQHYLSRSSSDAQRAIDAFRRAIAIDPDHAGAHAGLARGLIALGFIGTLPHPGARAMALAEARQALTLDPDSSDAHAVLADLQFYYDWDWAGADASYQRAIALNTSFARAHSQYARYLAAASRGREAVSEASNAVALEPTSASAVSTKALAYYYARDYVQALQTIENAIQLEPDVASVHIIRSRILSAQGAREDAIRSNERALVLAGPNAATGWPAHLVRLQALAGRTEEARAALGRLQAEAAASHARLGAAQLAYIYESLGEPAQALSLLERAAEDHDPEVLWLAVDPRVDSLRRDPRFARLLDRLGAPR